VPVAELFKPLTGFGFVAKLAVVGDVVLKFILLPPLVKLYIFMLYIVPASAAENDADVPEVLKEALPKVIAVEPAPGSVPSTGSVIFPEFTKTKYPSGAWEPAAAADHASGSVDVVTAPSVNAVAWFVGSGSGAELEIPVIAISSIPTPIELLEPPTENLILT
jgi:hypothetical protein